MLDPTDNPSDEDLRKKAEEESKRIEELLAKEPDAAAAALESTQRKAGVSLESGGSGSGDAPPSEISTSEAMKHLRDTGYEAHSSDVVKELIAERHRLDRGDDPLEGNELIRKIAEAEKDKATLPGQMFPGYSPPPSPSMFPGVVPPREEGGPSRGFLDSLKKEFQGGDPGPRFTPNEGGGGSPSSDHTKESLQDAVLKKDATDQEVAHKTVQLLAAIKGDLGIILRIVEEGLGE